MDAAINALEEADQHLNAALIAADFDPLELERIEERLFALRGAARKYSTPVDALAALAQRYAADVALIDAGADGIKVGIGPGSVCTTRKMTGVGYPQLSAIIECADAAHGLKGFVCGDGGLTVPGDVAKAYGGGADFVMMGGMLAGHDECEGEIRYEERNGRKVPVAMTFYGMSSDTAMNKYSGGVAKYRASEGKTVEVPYRGPVEGTMQELMGGVRSAMTYIGAVRLKEMPKRTTFIMVGSQLNTIFGN